MHVIFHSIGLTSKNEFQVQDDIFNQRQPRVIGDTHKIHHQIRRVGLIFCIQRQRVLTKQDDSHLTRFYLPKVYGHVARTRHQKGDYCQQGQQQHSKRSLKFMTLCLFKIVIYLIFTNRHSYYN